MVLRIFRELSSIDEASQLLTEGLEEPDRVAERLENDRCLQNRASSISELRWEALD